MSRALMHLYKHHLRTYMREHYTDERLAMLLAHAQSGKLAWRSCCCFVGIATSNHSLRGTMLSREIHVDGLHIFLAMGMPWGKEANMAYRHIAGTDAARRRILIPMIRAEMRRRELLKASSAHDANVNTVKTLAL